MDELLEKSEALNSEFSKVFDYGPINDDKRVTASWIMCLVALEHASSLRQLVMCGNYTSVICIIRSQFEALTRAIWLFYAASDERIDKTLSTLNELSQNADQKPSNAEMIKALDGKAPPQAVSMISEFRDVQWGPLNSYIHGGIHALQRHATGYPEVLIEQIIKSSNELLAMTTMMAAILTGNVLITKDIAAIQRRHADCLPEALPH
ncbi:MAG: hypothetical protein ACJAS1_006923 [Oleiphilaceae bacterium]|jgi:hypothetical protein